MDTKNNQTQKVRVAIIGASGIGKHHAKWCDIIGCEVVAFVGRTSGSIQSTAKTLREMFGIEAKGYCDCDEMLETEKPDVVIVSSPPPCHKEHAVKALEAGCNVFCEKPLVYDAGKSIEELRSDARDIITAAKNNPGLFAINTQYAAAIPHYKQIYEEAQGPLEKFNSAFMHMESKSGREYIAVISDLLPHPISLLLKWIPDGDIATDSIQCRVEKSETNIQFDYCQPNGHRCKVQFILGDTTERKPIRRLGVNGLLVDYGGRNDENGVFRTTLTYEGKEYIYEDLMCASIKSFVSAVTGNGEVLVGPEEAYKNNEHALTILKAAGHS